MATGWDAATMVGRANGCRLLWRKQCANIRKDMTAMEIIALQMINTIMLEQTFNKKASSSTTLFPSTSSASATSSAFASVRPSEHGQAEYENNISIML